MVNVQISGGPEFNIDHRVEYNTLRAMNVTEIRRLVEHS
jgi:hypothetical protein